MSEQNFDLTDDDQAVTFAVRVVPRSGKSGVMGLHDGGLKIRVAAPPVEGAANAALIEYLAKLFRVPKRDVTLVAGETSKRKRVRIVGVTGEQIKKLI